MNAPDASVDVIVMEPVSEEEWFDVPSSMAEWEERRLEYLAATTPASHPANV